MYSRDLHSRFALSFSSAVEISGTYQQPCLYSAEIFLADMNVQLAARVADSNVVSFGLPWWAVPDLTLISVVTLLAMGDLPQQLLRLQAVHWAGQ